MTNDYIYAIYELQSLFSRLLTNTMPASSNISKMFRAKETYYVRKIIEELAHLKVVNYDSTLKHEVMQNCANYAIELTAVYAQYLEVGESDDCNDWGILNDPDPIANQEPTIPYLQSIIDNFIEANDADGNAIDFHHPDIQTPGFSPVSIQSVIDANKANDEEEDYKHDSAQLNLASAAIVEYNMDNVIFVRSVIHDDVIYILPRYDLKIREDSHSPNGELYLTIGYADVCVFTESKLSVGEAKKYIIRLEKTIATNALDPRAVDLKSKGGIPVLTLQGYNWREYCEREECKIFTPEKDRNVILRTGFKIARNTPDDLDHVELNWDNPYPFHFWDLPDRHSDYVLVPTCASDDGDYKVSDYDLIRYLPKGLIDKEGIAVNNIWGLEETLNDCAMSFKIFDALKTARISNPQRTPLDVFMVRGVKKGCVLLTFDMIAIDHGPDSTFVEFRRLMTFPIFDQLDQKKDNYIDMDIGHWGLTKYFFSSRSSIQSKIFEGCRLSATTFKSLMLSIYNISPIGEFEDFIRTFVKDESPVDDDRGYKEWCFYNVNWADFQHLKDKDTLSLYVAHLLYSLGSFEFYYHQESEVCLYSLKSNTYDDAGTHSLKLELAQCCC